MEGKEAGGVSLSKIMYRVFEDIRDVLPNHTSYFRPHFGDWYGLAMFIKKDIEVLEESCGFQGFAGRCVEPSSLISRIQLI